MKRVQHATYGQGVLLDDNGIDAKVKFDSGVTTTVASSELLDVILG